MSRCLSQVRKQIQDASDLFASRYGKDSSIAEIAVKTLVSATLLEHELMLLEGQADALRRLPSEYVEEVPSSIL
jgi:hypothetical protein